MVRLRGILRGATLQGDNVQLTFESLDLCRIGNSKTYEDPNSIFSLRRLNKISRAFLFLSIYRLLRFKMGGLLRVKRAMVVGLIWIMTMAQRTEGMRFVIDREECFSHSAPYEGDTFHISFVVIKTDTAWHYGDEGVDLVIKGPSGEHIHEFHDKISEKFEFIVQTRGLYRLCFRNRSPYLETIDFDVHISHFLHFDQHAKDEHFNPMLEQISKLEEALYNIQFEQHWLEAETARQAIVNEGMSRRAIHKAILESAALIGASLLQLYLLQCLFERRIGASRV